MQMNFIKKNENEELFKDFLEEIDAHFRYVIHDVIKWSISDVYISRGNNNIVIKFKFDTNNFIFRVPIFGSHQIESMVKAHLIFSNYNFFSRILYADEKCLIEPFINGSCLSSSSGVEVYKSIALALNEIHSHRASGFGWLKSSSEGSECNIDEYYKKYIEKPWILFKESGLIKEDGFQFLDYFSCKCIDIIRESPTVVCHGDIWSKNIICNDLFGIKIIDWESIGVYSCEKDLGFLFDRGVSKKQRDSFFNYYNYDYDVGVVYWYKLVNIVVYIFGERPVISNHHLKRLLSIVVEVFNYFDFGEIIDISDVELDNISVRLRDKYCVQ